MCDLFRQLEILAAKLGETKTATVPHDTPSLVLGCRFSLYILSRTDKNANGLGSNQSDGFPNTFDMS